MGRPCFERRIPCRAPREIPRKAPVFGLVSSSFKLIKFDDVKVSAVRGADVRVHHVSCEKRTT